MRLYNCLSLSTLLIICLLGHNVLGAPSKDRYRRVKCINQGCIQKTSTLMDLPGPNQQPIAQEPQEIDQVLDSDESSETEEQSGEGSGDPIFLFDGAQKEQGNGLDNWQQETEQNGVEESSGETIYDNNIAPEKPKLSIKDLEMDNMIQ